MVFVTGATGYLGRVLLARLVERGHRVRALVRPGSERRVPPGCEAVVGDALRADSYRERVAPADTLIQLVGTAKPAPWKGAAFRAVDGPSGLAAVAAARFAGVRHLIYVSVAHPAPIMRSYIEVRRGCEEEIRKSGISATILRPWYVLGPGHWWPLAILPISKVLEAIPATRESARRLGFVWQKEMVGALVWAVEHPADGLQVLRVPEIRALGNESNNDALTSIDK